MTHYAVTAFHNSPIFPLCSEREVFRISQALETEQWEIAQNRGMCAALRMVIAEAKAKGWTVVHVSSWKGCIRSVYIRPFAGGGVVRVSSHLLDAEGVVARQTERAPRWLGEIIIAEGWHSVMPGGWLEAVSSICKGS